MKENKIDVQELGDSEYGTLQCKIFGLILGRFFQRTRNIDIKFWLDFLIFLLLYQQSQVFVHIQQKKLPKRNYLMQLSTYESADFDCILWFIYEKMHSNRDVRISLRNCLLVGPMRQQHDKYSLQIFFAQHQTTAYNSQT